MISYDKPINLKVDKTYRYLYFIDRDHPLASNNAGRVHYHRHIASLSMGRWLLTGEDVHHKDGNKANNDPSNLLVLSHSEHMKLHMPASGGYTKVCPRCGKEFNTPYKSKYICSMRCVQRVHLTREQVVDALSLTKSMLGAARTFGISDNALRKRCVGLGIEFSRPRKPPRVIVKPRTGLVHGTRSAYTYYKCRCDICRKANSQYAKSRPRIAKVKSTEDSSSG